MIEPPDDAVEAALALIEHLERASIELRLAVERADQILRYRAQGVPWRDIETDAARPLIIEILGRVHVGLGVAGSRFRRAEARALREEGLSVTEIGQLFGVTRQRASEIIKDRSGRGANP